MPNPVTLEIFPIDNTSEQISVVANNFELDKYDNELEMKVVATYRGHAPATYTELQLLALMDRELQVHVDGLGRTINEKIWWITNIEVNSNTTKHRITLQDTDPNSPQPDMQTLRVARACTCSHE